jgi:hypothetical protein
VLLKVIDAGQKSARFCGNDFGKQIGVAIYARRLRKRKINRVAPNAVTPGKIRIKVPQ